MESSNYLVDAGPAEVVVYVDSYPNGPVEQQRFDRGADTDVDTVLAANGWKRVGKWARSDDTPAGHRLAAVEPAGYPDGTRYGPTQTVDPIDVLERDQRAGRIRRGINTPLALLAVVVAITAGCGAEDAVDDWTRGYAPCATEDSAGPCFWDAEVFGNGEGRSFLVQPGGQVVYVNDAGIPMPTGIDVGH